MSVIANAGSTASSSLPSAPRTGTFPAAVPVSLLAAVPASVTLLSVILGITATSRVLPVPITGTFPFAVPVLTVAAVPRPVILLTGILLGISSALTFVAAVTIPLASTVTLVYVPAVTPLFFNVAAMLASALPSNEAVPVTSPVNVIFCAAANLLAVAALVALVAVSALAACVASVALSAIIALST